MRGRGGHLAVHWSEEKLQSPRRRLLMPDAADHRLSKELKMYALDTDNEPRSPGLVWTGRHPLFGRVNAPPLPLNYYDELV